MENTIDILKYLFSNYPYASELSKARAVKMVYLADWKSAIKYDKQLTDVKWIYNHYGPYVDDVIGLLRSDSAFEIIPGFNSHNQPKELIKLVRKVDTNLSPETREILDFVIQKTSFLNWEEFIKLVYSTYPIIKEKKLSELNLINLAREYKNVLEQRTEAK